MIDKEKELSVLKARLINPNSAYSFESYPADKYSEDDFSFLHDIETTVDFKFKKGVLFDKEVFYISTEPKKILKASPNYTFLTKPVKNVRKSRKGWCYLLSDGEYQKIGITTASLTKRVSQIQNGNPKKITAIAKYEVSTDVFFVEKQLHKLFKNTRVIGEWFSSSISGEEFIALCNKYDKDGVD